MMTLTALTEVLRRREIGDPVSKISVDLKTPKSTVRGWLKFAQQHGLTFKKVAGMTLKQFKEICAQSSQPCARMLQPDWDNVVAESRKPGMTLQALYEDYCRTSPTKPHMKRSSFYLKYKQVKKSTSSLKPTPVRRPGSPIPSKTWIPPCCDALTSFSNPLPLRNVSAAPSSRNRSGMCSHPR